MTHAKCDSCNKINEIIQMTKDAKGYTCKCGYSYWNKTLYLNFNYMNQAIPLDKHLRAKESADRLHIYTTGALPKDIRDDMKILVNFVKSISSLPSDTQWIDALQRYKPNEFPSENEVYTMEEFYNRDNSLMLKSIAGEYIRYDDLKKLLED